MIRRTLLALFVFAVLALCGVYAWGLSIPATTTVKRDVQFAATPAEVHARISDVRGQRVGATISARLRSAPTAGDGQSSRMTEARLPSV